MKTKRKARRKRKPVNSENMIPVCFRLSRDEKESLEAQAEREAGGNSSELIRRWIRNQRVTVEIGMPAVVTPEILKVG